MLTELFTLFVKASDKDRVIIFAWSSYEIIIINLSQKTLLAA
jgi:hypothetical protein